MKIFFDLDGTLLNSMDRLYRLFQQLVPSSQLSYSEYWGYKKNKIGHTDILKNHFSFTDEQIKKFQSDWMGLIETPEWLALDRPVEGVSEYLVTLKTDHELYVVTARQFEKKVLEQLIEYGLLHLFKAIFVTGGTIEKYDLVRKNVTTDAEDWFVGDTGKDIQTGKKLGIKTAAVGSGFLNKEKLAEYGPDMIIDNILQFKIPKT